MIQSLRNPKVIQFIQENLHVNSADLVLASSNYPDLPIKEIAIQIESRKRIKNKLPEWYANVDLILPRKDNLEQASSEATAKYKAELFQGERMLDLTGGSGVDTFAFSKYFEQIDFVEPNVELCDLARHNFSVLNAPVEVINSTAETFLALNKRKYDLIYLDPSRRSDSTHRFVALEDYLPNIIELQNSLFDFTDKILVKASPMLDIHIAIDQLHQVSKVICLAVDNEMKELLFVMDKKGAQKSPEIICENIGSPKQATFSMFLEEEKQVIPTYSEPKTYIYDPLTAIRKGGGFNVFSDRFNLGKLSPNTHLYTSDERVDDIPARIFKVIKTISASSKIIKKISTNGFINVISKNYPLTANEIKRKYKLNDGGDQFLIFCTTLQKKQILLCEIMPSEI